MIRVTITENNPIFGTTTTSIDDAEHSALLEARAAIDHQLAVLEEEARHILELENTIAPENTLAAV